MKPLSMDRQTALNLLARSRGARAPAQMRDQPVQHNTERRKYSNVKVQDGGATFDSKAEHRRWQYLVTLERAGSIRDLERQVPYELIPAQMAPSGKKERATLYMADFRYVDATGRVVVEDVKGAVTPEFRLKRKLMLWRHGIEVQEIRS